ncbi:MAG: 2-polyprenyl-3-methyl-6-methoxy-1,4-benzoquinone monooxygenase [Ketobacteraceae bacterium]|nr:2-polyprenyl-3-methyl-6-methoxy-1,4-benzoquinone monooxygenase [Ketobacteraceae bacterium]
MNRRTTHRRKTVQQRQHSLVDRLIKHTDNALRTIAGTHGELPREHPAHDVSPPALSEKERRHVAGLMRINHTGEVCAQALYAGQAVTARLPRVRKAMEHAAKEEEEHLWWCETRLQELDAHTSIFNPAWYAMSFGIGAAAGFAGDRWSLGFVEETEIQVCEHINKHIANLPAQDERTRKILNQMHDDEARHAAMAKKAGASELPKPVKKLMTFMSKVMTKTTYHL